jgi:hypothetical protein
MSARDAYSSFTPQHMPAIIMGLRDRSCSATSARGGQCTRFGPHETPTRHRFSPNHAIEITDELGERLHMTRYGDCVDVRL